MKIQVFNRNGKFSGAAHGTGRWVQRNRSRGRVAIAPSGSQNPRHRMNMDLSDWLCLSFKAKFRTTVRELFCAIGFTSGNQVTPEFNRSAAGLGVLS
jgi:hypothetical protein